jgi:membrane-bound lytic murein transglycosylase B
VRGLLALILAVAAPQQAPPPPAADAPLPRRPAQLATAFTDTTRRLRATGWDGTGAVPRDFSLLALHHQRILRRMAERRRLGDATLKALPRDVKGEARDTVRARRFIDAIPRGKPPKVRVARAAPAAELRSHYADAQRRFGIHWSVLASINFVESAFGRVRSASEAGARGPMQFLPSTWAAYGAGGDIEDPHDAILAAARYLKASGAPRDLDRALYAYNHSTAYVRAIRRFAARMRADERTFRTYYAWQVYVRTPSGGSKRITGEELARAAEHPGRGRDRRISPDVPGRGPGTPAGAQPRRGAHRGDA